MSIEFRPWLAMKRGKRQINRLTGKDIDSRRRSLFGWPGLDRDFKFFSGCDRSINAVTFVSHKIKTRPMREDC